MKFPKNYIIYKGVVYDLDKSDKRRAENRTAFLRQFDNMAKRADTRKEHNRAVCMMKAAGSLPGTPRERCAALLAAAGYAQRRLPDFHA